MLSCLPDNIRHLLLIDAAMQGSTKNRINVPDPIKLTEALEQVLSGLYTVFESARENELAPVSEQGVTRYMPEHGKTGFQVAGQFERAGDFIQTLMDMMRVQYAPDFVGSFLLNANIGFLIDAMPGQPFQLGYATRISRDHQSFQSFWEDDVVPHLETIGYSLQEAASLFVVVTTGPERFDMALITETMSVVGGGFTVDEVADAFSEAFQDEESLGLPSKEVHSGFIMDEALGARFRVSVWCFTPSAVVRMQ